MRYSICVLSCCLLGLALLARGTVSSAAEPPADTGSTQEEQSQPTEEPRPDGAARQTETTSGAASAAVTDTAKSPPASKPATHTVRKEPLKIKVTLSGTFEAQEMAEISLRPEAWTSLTVLTAVEHGTRVNQGDLLVSLETDKIDREIADLRADLEISEVALKLAEQRLQTLEKTTPMDLAASQRARSEVREDLDYYFQTSRPMTLKSADLSLKLSQQELEYQQEELRQLEKMYAADDLTEETEEIILKRARNDLERAEFSLERSKLSHDRNVNVLIPRNDLDIRESADHIELSLNDTEATLPLTLQRQRLDLEKLRRDRSRSEERLDKLVADRAAMTVKAPMAGVVYYGRSVRGKFSGSSPSDTSLRPGGNLPTKQVFMTIVKPRPMFVRANVPERHLHAVRAGIKGTAVPAGYPEMKLTAIVEHVAAVPAGSGDFDSRITVALSDEAEPLMPGMTCDLSLVVYEKKDALTIPAKCLLTDEEDEEKHYVHLLSKDDKPEKRYVTVGKRPSGRVEILEGLAEGDRVLLEPPKEEESPQVEQQSAETPQQPPKDEAAPDADDGASEKGSPNDDEGSTQGAPQQEPAAEEPQ